MRMLFATLPLLLTRGTAWRPSSATEGWDEPPVGRRFSFSSTTPRRIPLRCSGRHAMTTVPPDLTLVSVLPFDTGLRLPPPGHVRDRDGASQFAVPMAEKAQTARIKTMCPRWRIWAGRHVEGCPSSPCCPPTKFGGSASLRLSAVLVTAHAGSDGRLRRIPPVLEVQLRDDREARARPLVAWSVARMPTDIAFDEAVIPQGDKFGGVIRGLRRCAGGRVGGRRTLEIVAGERIVEPEGYAAAERHSSCGGR